MVYGTQITSNNYSYWGESKPTDITGGPHIVPKNSWYSTSRYVLPSSDQFGCAPRFPMKKTKQIIDSGHQSLYVLPSGNLTICY